MFMKSRTFTALADFEKTQKIKCFMRYGLAFLANGTWTKYPGRTPPNNECDLHPLARNLPLSFLVIFPLQPEHLGERKDRPLRFLN